VGGVLEGDGSTSRPFGTFEEYAPHLWFQSNHFITFEPEPTPEARRWWLNKAEALASAMPDDGVPLAPEFLARALIDGFSSVTEHCRVAVRRETEDLAFESSGTLEDGASWLSAQVLDFADGALWKGLTDIPPQWQGYGLSRSLMRNAYRVARLLGLTSIKLRAIEIGSYAWLRYGFRPDDESWEGPLKADIATRLAELLAVRAVGETARARVLRFLGGDDPALANAIAAERQLVPSLRRGPDGRPVLVPLGRALIAEANGGRGCSWQGTLALNDPAVMRVFLDYVGLGT
jgi:GNAT superfamily N-acetyltransferase